MEVPEEHAGPGEVRLRVTAAAVNPTDTYLVLGAYADRDPVKEPPWVPGMDAAGVLDEIGEDIAPEIIASGREIDALASQTGDAPTEELEVTRGWRRTLVGETLVAIARGELAMRFDPARRAVVGDRVSAPPSPSR